MSKDLHGWVVRLEDVHPNGEVSLVAGAALNGAQRSSRTKPEAIVPGRLYDLTIDMHFTSWTFEPGHRVRLAVSNSLFPMLWPTPHRMTTELHVGGEATRLLVPRIPMEDRPVPNFRASELRRTDARYLEGSPRKVTVERDLTTSTTTYAIGWDGGFEIKDRLHYAYENHQHGVSDVNPAEASYEGEAGHRITIGERVVELKTFLSLRSYELNFFARFTRRLSESGRLVREHLGRDHPTQLSVVGNREGVTVHAPAKNRLAWDSHPVNIMAVST